MAHPTVSLSSFEKALDHFKIKSGLTQRELAEMESTTLDDLQQSLMTMQNSQQKSRTMRYLGRLQPFLDAMQQYGKVIDVFVNTSNLVAFIWPTNLAVWSPRDALADTGVNRKTTSSVVDAFNALLEGYNTIGEQMPLLMQYRQLFEKNVYMQSALTSIFEDILEFHLEAVKLFKQRTWKQLFHATQRSLTRRIDEITKSIGRHRAILEAQTTVIQYEEFQASMMVMKGEFAHLRAADDDQRRVRVQNWLAITIDSLARHENLKKDRFAATGQWLLDHPRFQAWFVPTRCVDPLLWLHGMPGAGKTVLASRVIDEVRQLKSVTGVHFYCKDTDDPKTGQALLMKSMISQILTQNDFILDYLHNEMSDGRESTLISMSLIKRLLEVSIRSCNKVYVVIDGLDEYPRDVRKDVASWFQNLIYDTPSDEQASVRCLFVSQDDGPGRKDLSMLAQLKVTAIENAGDMEAYCADWHKKIESKFGSLVEPVHDVTRVVSARARGMFLYAKLVLWNLYEQTNRADFELEMRPDCVPTGVDEAYNRIVARLLGPNVPASRCNSIKRLLGWLVCAKRPLRWHEIQAAVVIDLEEGSRSAKLRFDEDCKDLCASLVDISLDQTITLVHSTTRSFLIRKDFVHETQAHFDLAKVCILYLNMPEMDLPKPHDEIKSAYLDGYYTFVEYAVCFWPFHFELAFKDLDKHHKDKANVLAECFEVFLDMYWVATGKSETPSQKLKGYLAHLETHDWFEKACAAVSTAKSWQRPLGKPPGDSSVLRLPIIVSQLRSSVEQLLLSTDLQKQEFKMIDQYYGRNHFKCDRLNCQYFHQGFAAKLQREQHVAKHDRAFTCTWEGCPFEIFGFATSDGLRKHAIEQHGVIVGTQPTDFPDEDVVVQASENKSGSKFQCEICNKTFSRAYNLKSHQRSHADARPFPCTICGKAFSRKSDVVRHEKAHSGEKKFVCQGELDGDNGQQWGCGRSFARADALALHFQSELGRSCIAPLRAHHEAARALLQMTEDGKTASEEVQMASQQLVKSLLLPSLSEMPSPILEDNPILPDLDWAGYDTISRNEWATKLSQDHSPNAPHGMSETESA